MALYLPMWSSTVNTLWNVQPDPFFSISGIASIKKFLLDLMASSSWDALLMDLIVEVFHHSTSLSMTFPFSTLCISYRALK